MGLESMLLGAHAEGVRNVLAVTGDPPEVGDYPGARGVYEIDSIGLTQLMTNLNRGEDFNGRPIDAPTSFFPGVAVNPTPDDMDRRDAKFDLRQDSGSVSKLAIRVSDNFPQRMLGGFGSLLRQLQTFRGALAHGVSASFDFSRIIARCR